MNNDKNSKSENKGKIIVFSAASGAGKTTILNHLRSVLPYLVYSISATTRMPRPHEKEGIDYYFMSTDEFKEKIKAGVFAEWAEVHGNYYGTPMNFINKTIKSGKNIIMDIDVYGKVKFDRIYPEAIGIFLKPPSIEELERRLRERDTDSDEVIAVRISNAEKEMLFAENKGKYKYTIINDNLECTKSEVIELVKRIIRS